jgi:hypothetical protein
MGTPRWLFVGTLSLLAGAALWMRFRPLSPEQVDRDLGPDPDLAFEFGADADVPIACGGSDKGDDPRADQNAAAAAVGWVTRRCEHGRTELRFTPAGRRLAARSPVGGAPADAADGAPIATTYSLAVARFERTGRPEILAAPGSTRRRVVVHGRWVPNDEGKALAQAGWPPLQGPAVREEVFDLRWSGWRLMPSVLGRDLSDM